MHHGKIAAPSLTGRPCYQLSSWPYFVWRFSSWVVALNAKGSSKTGRLKGICTQITDCGAYCCDMLWLCMLILLRRRTQQRTPPLPTPLTGHQTAHPIQLKGLPDQWSVMVSCVCVTWVTWVQFRSPSFLMFFDETMWESWEGMEWKGYDDDTFGLGYKDLIQTNVSRNSSKIGEQADAEEYHNLGDDVEVWSRFTWYLICTSMTRSNISEMERPRSRHVQTTAALLAPIRIWENESLSLFQQPVIDLR